MNTFAKRRGGSVGEQSVVPEHFARSPFSISQAKFVAKMAALDVAGIVDLKADFDEDRIALVNSMKAPVAVFIHSELVDLAKLNNPFVYCIFPFEIKPKTQRHNTIVEVTSLEQALECQEMGFSGLIVKGNEASGRVGPDATFILFQKIQAQVECPIWIRGGCGIHTAAAAIALGAKGLVFEDESYLFPEFGIAKELKPLFSSFDGSETRVVDATRFYLNHLHWPKELNKDEISPDFLASHLSSVKAVSPVLYVGQAIGLASHNFQNYSTFRNYLTHLIWAKGGHFEQALQFSEMNLSRKRLFSRFGVDGVVAQGPMTRVSDVPEFTKAVASEKGLPFIALALMRKTDVETLLSRTKSMLTDQCWGVGILGFADDEIQDEQYQVIKSICPPVVLVAGGNASHVKKYEAIGCHVFIHAPSLGLLESYVNSGVTNFVFEGRECGGHVGPLSSFVLWEKQISFLLSLDSIADLSIYFAGGVHDELSSAFISIMAAPLVARGAAVGVLMGTAYLYTEEAVSSGAISNNYRNETLDNSQTALLEYSGGHVVRCLSTPIVDQFNHEKRRLLNENTDSSAVREALEYYTIGALRLASKGIKRVNGKRQEAPLSEQAEQGLFMVGQVATFKKEPSSVASLHQKVTQGASALLAGIATSNKHVISQQNSDSSGNIAIVGMSCIFPDATSPSEYWANILASKNSVTPVPKERWDSNVYFDADAKKGSKSNSMWGGFLPSVEFDPLEFGIPPQSIKSIDPAQLLALKVSKEALIDSGYWDDEGFDRDLTGVVFGLEGGSELLLGYELKAIMPKIFGDASDALNATLPALTEDSFAGTLPNVVSGRVANRLNLKGRNLVVDAACASSLAALDVACQELRTGRADMMVAGAVDLHNDIIDYLKFSSVGALSTNGSCKSYSQDAAGISLGEGVGVVILKRLADAERDNDRIYSVIKGIGSSSDGKALGLTAPNKSGQNLAYKRAYEEAGISPSSVKMIEGHGTGTVVGDRAEMQSLTEFFSLHGATSQSITLGSVKSQIGHTKCAAGMAALIKGSLAVYHGVKPPTMHVETPNSVYDEEFSQFEFQKTANVWNDQCRVAGVSAFGFGGTNFHAVIQNHDSALNNPRAQQDWPSELVVLRACDRSELTGCRNQVASALESNPRIRLVDLAYTLSANNSEQPIQVAFSVSNHAELLKKLEVVDSFSLAQSLTTDDVLSRCRAQGVFCVQAVDGDVAFLFSGQGSQRVNMLRDIFVAFPHLRKALENHQDLIEILFPPQSFEKVRIDQQKATINMTQNAQPLLGLVDLCLAKLVSEFGISPNVLAGHSYGEVPALAFAGAIKENDIVEISRARAQAILSAVSTEPGVMLAANTDVKEVENLISNIDDVFVANHNTQTQFVFAGTTTGIKKLKKKMDSVKIANQMLPVACAFHSPIISGAKANFADEISKFDFEEPTISVWSNTTAQLYPRNVGEIKHRLSEHLEAPVKFCDQILQMQKAGVAVFVEVGPGEVLKNMASSILESKATSLAVCAGKKHGLSELVDFFAQYVATGKSFNVDRLYIDRDAKMLDLAELGHAARTEGLWRINGQKCLPISTKVKPEVWPLTKAVDQSTILRPQSPQRNELMSHTKIKEQLILDYLENMRLAAQAQHQVVLRYLGETSDSEANSLEDKFSALSKLENSARAATVEEPLQLVDDDAVTVLPQSTPNEDETVRNSVLQIISQKTGYPIDMLDGDMDLEADLSIDSIKRTEIVAQIQLKYPALFRAEAESNDEGLTVQDVSSKKTINDVIASLSRKTKVEPKKEKATLEVVNNQATAEKTESDLLEIATRIVSNRTGYPTDMLSGDMDLEAELSIDSIKRTEIVNELRDALELDSDALIAALLSCKNLNDIVSKIAHSTNDRRKGASEKKTVAETDSLITAVSRYGFTTKLASDTKDVDLSLSGKKIAIFDDGTVVAKEINRYLESLGVLVEWLDPDAGLNHLDGVIHLDFVNSKKRLSSLQILTTTQKLDNTQLKWLFVATDLTHRLTERQKLDQVFADLRGYYGFLNSLNKEWNAICREINISHEHSKELGQSIADELFYISKEDSVVFLGDGKRYVGELVETPLQSSEVKDDLSTNDTVLVLGGAQGITSEILQDLADSVSCHYLLVGRSPLSDDISLDKSDAELGLCVAELKTLLLKTETFASPKALERRVNELYKQNQVHLTIRRLQAKGATVSYRSVDLTNDAELDLFVRNLRQEKVSIEGIIHAAGLLEDKLVVDKTPDSFMRIMSTKLKPVEKLIMEFEESLKCVMLFSSIASVFGNRGQTDYGMANAMLDQFALAANQLLKARVTSINWGPWSGKGMIDASLEKDLLNRGVTSISLREGARAFVNEFQYGDGGQVILMSPIVVPQQLDEIA